MGNIFNISSTLVFITFTGFTANLPIKDHSYTGFTVNLTIEDHSYTGFT